MTTCTDVETMKPSLNSVSPIPAGCEIATNCENSSDSDKLLVIDKDSKGYNSFSFLQGFGELQYIAGEIVCNTCLMFGGKGNVFLALKPGLLIGTSFLLLFYVK